MKCAHSGCKCEGKIERGGQSFCSDACASHGLVGGPVAGSGRGKCDCGHADCSSNK